MFFQNSSIRYFLISWVNCEQYGKNQYKKGTKSTQFSVQSLKITFVSLIFIFLSCREKVHDNKEFSRKNSKSCRQSEITTCYVEPW